MKKSSETNVKNVQNKNYKKRIWVNYRFNMKHLMNIYEHLTRFLAGNIDIINIKIT